MKFKLSQEKSQLAYSIFLILFIPISMVGGTIWLTSQVKSNFDLELRRKANLANEVFGVSVANALNGQTADKAASKIQTVIDQTGPQAPEIEKINVTVPGQGSDYRIIASSDSTEPNTLDRAPQTKFAFAQHQAVASLISEGEGEGRAWLVATPVMGSSGTPVAITSMRVSLAAADAVMSSTLRNAFIALSVLISVIVLMLLNHFRFVQYAELFRKQKELDQMKDDFISVATHELKAPMTIIKGYISMAMEEKPGKEIMESLRIAFDQTDRLARLVADLLDVSRLEQNRTKFNVSKVSLPEVIEPLVRTYGLKAKDKHLAIDYAKGHGPVPAVSADIDRVTEIFTNLIDNAIKYSPAGTVKITHSIRTGQVVTTIADTGIGMTPDEQSRLFQRFYRAKNADTAEIPGTGLGLWIIKQYAEKMGGTISVESEKGKGSRFSVVLPSAPSGGTGVK